MNTLNEITIARTNPWNVNPLHFFHERRLTYGEPVGSDDVQLIC